MPKIGMEPLRRAALVTATIEEIGQVGSLDVTVSAIASRAGMSSALAHHYFGGKEQIFLAAMRHILTQFGQEATAKLKASEKPLERAEAILAASFSDANFKPATISAWLNFYVLAQRSREAHRLLRIYQRRLQSNLCHALRPLTSNPDRTARQLSAVIDGHYIRAALHAEEGRGSEQLARATLHALLSMETGR